MEGAGKILGINALMVLGYSCAIYFIWYDDRGFDIIFLIASAYAIITLAGINLYISISAYLKKNNKKGNLYLLSTLFVLLVGGSVCVGGALGV